MDEKSELMFNNAARGIINSYFFVKWEETREEHVYIKEVGREDRYNIYVICDWRVHHHSPSCSFIFAYTKGEAIEKYLSNKI